MNENLKSLPKPEKKIIAKALIKMGWASRKIEEWLGVDHVSVTRYAKQPTPEELKQFETEFETTIKEVKQEGLALVLARLLKVIPKEERVDQLIKASEYFEGKKNFGTAIQQNFIGTTLSNEELERIIGN